MLVFLGYSFSLAMGFILGLIGAGGSILTIPILVYMLDIKPILATSYSLFIVGFASFIGAMRYLYHGHVNIKAALIFAIPAMLMIFFTRLYIVPNLPDPFLTIYDLSISKNFFIMFLFACLMILAALFMLKPQKIKLIVPNKKSHHKKLMRFMNLVLSSSFIGFLSGLIGAGGGFLIIPTLIGIFKLDVKEAIGTSLMIIAINSLVGFNGDLMVGIDLDWVLIALFLSFTLIGMMIGTSIGKNVDPRKLKKLFGWFTLLIAVCIITKESYIFFIN